MIEPLTLVLEFLRTENVDDPYAFRFARQTYSLRRGGGSYEKAEIAWDQALLDTLDAVRRPGRSSLVVQTLGESLSGFLSGTQWALYDEQIRAASAEKREILLIFRSAAAELYALPWELLALKKSGLQLGAVPNLLVRYEWPEADVRPPSAAATQEGGRILLAWSGQVPVDEHIAAIETAANAAYYPFQRETDILPHASAASLRQVLTAAQKDGPPITVLHLLCHGAADADGKTFGLLISSNEADTAAIIDAGSMRALLAPFADMVRLVVLSACDSGNMGALGNQLGSIAQGLHRAGIAAVIASRFPLSIKGANELTKSLYHSLLVESLSLEQSLRLGRQKLVENPAELDWASIQCFARADAGSDTRPLVIRPYRGLLPFQPEHQRFFFGRDEELGHLVKLQDDLVQAGKPRLIMVLGTAGTGKSSLVLAGLVPRLLATRPQLAVARMRPSGDPEAMLESQLTDLRDSHAVDGQPGELGAVLLVIDQFEALFTDVSDASRRQAFMERLWGLASDPKGSVQVLIALRVEQLARCAELMLDGSHQRLDSLAGSPAHRYLLNRVDPKYFKDIIEKPAQVVGLRLEDGLVERLLADASEMAGAQPLLEDILDVLWQHRRGNLLTQAASSA